MKNIVLTTMVLTSMSAIAQDIHYPKTQTSTVSDQYFGTTVNDNYRWLEDDMSPQTAQWVKQQNTITFNYLDKIPYRDAIRERLEKLWNYEKISAPFTEGAFTYYFKNDGLQNQSVLYRKDKSGKEEIFLDPNTFSPDGTTSLANISFSKDGSLVAYSISEAGSDWNKITVLDAVSKKKLGAEIVDVKFSGIAWQGNHGFYYSSYDKPKGSGLSALTDQHKLYFHKLGTSQKDDKVIFGLDQKRRYVGANVTEDERFLVINASNSTSGNELYIKDLTNPTSKITTMSADFKYDSEVIYNIGSTLYVSTNMDAPNQKVVTVDAAAPARENWKPLIRETKDVMSATTGGGFLFARYMKDAISVVEQYGFDGKLIRIIELPGIGTAGGFSGKKEEPILYYSFTNYISPGTIYAFDPRSGESKIYQKPNVEFDSENYESKQVFYQSKDGTRIPMIVTHKKGITLDGKNPTILYGYGGFNVSLTPGFGVQNVVWMEQGGIYAVANLRGGGEYGKSWHNAGIKLQKQNVFDDFIAAAEYLFAQKYTSSDFLAIRGGSNGGLLVGAVMTQRPELARVALPAVGVLDMLRYHTFTAGAGWAYDYGTANESKEMFEYLKGYSPLHNIKNNVSYPATLITTGDHDDRVVPAHSFKFAAELQSKQTGSNPVLIRIETNAGHGAGKPVSKTIAELADIFAFTLFNMGFSELPN